MGSVKTLVATLVVLSCILAPLSVISIWTRNQILDTSRYVDNVTPLASNPATTPLYQAVADVAAQHPTVQALRVPASCQQR